MRQTTRATLREFLEAIAEPRSETVARPGGPSPRVRETPADAAARVLANLKADPSPRPYTHSPATEVAVDLDAEASTDPREEHRRIKAACDAISAAANDLGIDVIEGVNVWFYVLDDVVLAQEWVPRYVGPLVAIKLTEAADDGRSAEDLVKLSTGFLAIPPDEEFDVVGGEEGFAAMRSLIVAVIASSVATPSGPLQVRVSSEPSRDAMLASQDEYAREQGLRRSEADRMRTLAEEVADNPDDCEAHILVSFATADGSRHLVPTTSRDDALFAALLRHFAPRGHAWLYGDMGSHSLLAYHSVVNETKSFEIGADERPDPAEAFATLVEWCVAVGEDQTMVSAIPTWRVGSNEKHPTAKPRAAIGSGTPAGLGLASLVRRWWVRRRT